MFDNEVKLYVAAKSQNEGLCRVTAAAFVTPLDPTVSELSDIKTVVSEAVTNAIVHGYDGREGEVLLRLAIEGKTVTVEVTDWGVGIPDVKKAVEPLFTTKPEQERSGMGFSVMEAFVDDLCIESAVGKGTTVRMVKTFENTSRT